MTREGLQEDEKSSMSKRRKGVFLPNVGQKIETENR